MSWGATLKQSPISSWQPLIWLPWSPMRVYLPCAPFIHQPHPFHFWMAGWLQKLPLSTMRAEYLTMNTKYLGKTSTTFKVRAPSNSLSVYTHPLSIPSFFSCAHESIIPSLYGGMSGEEVVNDLLRLGTKVSDWRRNSRHWGSVDDKVRLMVERGDWQSEGEKQNGWGVLLWLLALFCFSFSLLLHPYPHRGQKCQTQINTAYLLIST